MANVALTLRCNRLCTYCFARDAIKETGLRDMPADIFSRSLDAVAASGKREVRLLGGEPTMHPQFLEFLHEALAREFHVQLFTNGRLQRECIHAISSIPLSKLSVLLNMNAHDAQAETTYHTQIPFMRKLATRVMAGFNIHTPYPDFAFLIEAVESFGLKRCVRLGLAHGAPWMTNQTLQAKDYRRVGDRIADFAVEAQRRDIQIVFDCGFVPCMFPPELFSLPNVDIASIGNRCNPIPDLLPDGSVVPCFALSAWARISLRSGCSTRQLQKALFDKMKSLRQLTIYAHCENCDFLGNGDCRGGCRGIALSRAAYASIPRIHDRIALAVEEKPVAAKATWSIPYIDQPVAFWRHLADDFGSAIDSVYFPSPAPSLHLRTGRPPQPNTHLEAFVRARPIDGMLLMNAPTYPEGVNAVWKSIRTIVHELADEGAIHAVTVSSVDLAVKIRSELPYLRIVASVLLDLHAPLQIEATKGVFDMIVLSSRAQRDLEMLKTLRSAFKGEICMIVNEGCLPGCPWRAQHFAEMAAGRNRPESLCEKALTLSPWLSLTGAWVLPQHLHFFDGIVDHFKLAGRVTLRNPVRYRRVLQAYIQRTPLCMDEIGGGPASPRLHAKVDRSYYEQTLHCGRRCHECNFCRDVYAKLQTQLAMPSHPAEPSAFFL